MEYILLARYFVENLNPSTTLWIEYRFNPVTRIVETNNVVNSVAFELATDALVYTDPVTGDEYFYTGSNDTYKVDGPGITPPTPLPNVGDTYGIRYILEYEKQDTGVTVLDELYLKDYAGEPEDINGQAEPFTLTIENKGKVLESFRGSSATLGLQTRISKQFFPLFGGDERTWYLLHKEDGVVTWTGWVVPDIYREPYGNPPYQITVKFTDGIAGLKDIDFPDINGNGYTGTASEKDILIACLNQIGLNLDTWIALNLTEDGMSGTDIPAEQSFVNVEAFVELDKAENLPLKCYDVLEKILKSWNATLFQEDNHWWVIREPELYTGTIAYKRFDYTGASLGTGSKTVGTTFAAAGIKLSKPVMLETVPAFKNVAISQLYGGLLVPNGNFAVNGTFDDWTPIAREHDYIYRLKNWTYYRLDNWPAKSGTNLGRVRRREEPTGLNETNNYINIYNVRRDFVSDIGYIESEPVQIKSEAGNVINVSFKMRCNTRFEQSTRLVEAYFVIALRCGTKWLGVDAEGEWEWKDAHEYVRWKVTRTLTWESITINRLSIPEDGELAIRLHQIVQVGSTDKVEYVSDWDDVVISLADNQAILNDKLYFKTENPDVFTTSKPELEIELGDAVTVMSQNAKIVDGAVTSGWKRTGELTSQPLAKLIAREFLNQYQVTGNKLTGISQTKGPISLVEVYEDSVNDAGKKYIFTGGTYRAKSGYWSPDFHQINQEETTTEIRQVLESSKANTGSSGGDGDPSENEELGSGGDNPTLPATLEVEGIKLNGLTIGGVKRLIEEDDLLEIPIYWEYNVTALDVDGVIENDGEINLL